MERLKVRGANIITIEKYKGAENYVEVNALCDNNFDADSIEFLEDGKLDSGDLFDIITNNGVKVIDHKNFNFDEYDNEDEADEFIKDIKKRYKHKIILESYCEF